MKFAVALAAAVVATFTTSVSAAACPPDELLRLIALASEESLPTCEAESNFNFLPPPGIPTQEQLDFMCASDACSTTLAALRAIGPSDCDSTFSNGVTLNIKSVVDIYYANCGRRLRR